MARKESWGVQSGSGYFLKFESGAPKMTSDPVEATRMSMKDAEGIIKIIKRIGFEACLFKIVQGTIDVAAD